MKKQFFRVKQIADQTFLRAEKSDVLTEDLLTAEKRVDSIKVSCQTAQKKISSCQIDFGSETSVEKRLKKIPQVLLGMSMLESGSSFSKSSLLGETLRECSSAQTKIGSDLLDYYTEVEKVILKPIAGILDNEVHNINKLRKQLGKLVLDMDSARTRYQTAEKHISQTSANNYSTTVGKVDNLKEELEDASQKVDQCRDVLATEMFSLISKEPQIAQMFVNFHKLQAAYHRNALTALEASMPLLENLINDFPQKPVYGLSLEEHLRVTNREIAQVIETCVSFLFEYGLLEEGLLRVAGSASKLKKIKSVFDAGLELDTIEYIKDPHSVSGALKSYLRELPEPLLTFSLYDEWADAAKITDFESKLVALWAVLHKLPEANFKNLKYVLKFLAKLSENMEVNKMSAQNIAIVMGPNLMWSPHEDPNTLGMNMTSASLHTSIVDLLIAYFDWFFADTNTVPQLPNLSAYLNETRNSVKRHSSENEEINGNNLLATNSIENDPCPPSPRSSAKKPAAPSPPAQRTSLYPVIDEDLMQFSNDFHISALKEQPTVAIKSKDVFFTNDNRTENATTFEQPKLDKFDIVPPKAVEKPVVPDKPGYSSQSLDRRVHRQASNTARLSKLMGAPVKAGDAMSRSHIERPSVPPPERPIKTTSKFLSSENISSLTEQNKILQKTDVEDRRQSDGDNQRQTQLPSETPSEVPNMNEVVVPMPRTSKIESNLPHSRSSAKIDRFDFLVHQKEEKPPDRPPRLDGAVPSQETKMEMPNQSDTSTKVNAINSEVTVVPAVRTSLRSESEKCKPPRPQPPVPAKPKFIPNENTNL